MPRPVPPPALALIREFEGLRLAAYQDPVGIWTIGYGHTGPVLGEPLHSGRTITKQTAEALLIQDAQQAGNLIMATTKVTLNDGEYGALASFAFNLGWGALSRSTLWAKLQAGDRRAAADQFLRWNRAGRPLQIRAGLTRRRQAERLLFLS